MEYGERRLKQAYGNLRENDLAFEENRKMNSWDPSSKKPVKHFNLRPYDTGKAIRYEVPAEWTEEVSLTSRTDRLKLMRKNN